jgi:hypothetical protein
MHLDSGSGLRPSRNDTDEKDKPGHALGTVLAFVLLRFSSFRGASQRVRPQTGPMVNSTSEPGIQMQALSEFWIPGPRLRRVPE